jgi:peptidoglycan/LPS O-acetylase OafA/YrhL
LERCVTFAKPSEANPPRYEYIQVLRGIAALLVVIAHFFGTFWVYQKQLYSSIGLPAPQTVLLPAASDPLALQAATIVGQLGVAMFFAISGFVIPLALERESRRSFLIRRLFRIYPVYVAGFLTSAAVCYAVAVIMGGIYPHSFGHIFAHLFILARGVFGFARIDGVSWTLEVEVIFYLVAAALGPRLHNHYRLVFYAAAAVCTAATIVILQDKPFQFLSVQTISGLLLLSGYSTYLHVRKLTGKREFILMKSVVVTLTTLLFVYANYRHKLSLDWLWGMLLGLAVFDIARLMPGNLRGRALASRVADISYPLYVFHPLPGYAVMALTLQHSGSVTAAIVLAFTLALLVATLLHRFVELPSLSYARKVTERDRAQLSTPALTEAR